MSNHKAHRAKLNRSMRSMIGEYSMRTVPHDKPLERLEASAYKATLKHIRVSTKLGSRINIAMGFEGDRMSRIARKVIEDYETYRLRNKYAKIPNIGLAEFIAPLAHLTHMHRREIAVWYHEHGNERISRMRKMHAIVGTHDKPWLRTA